MFGGGDWCADRLLPDIVRAVASLGTSLGITTTAVGVETMRQLYAPMKLGHAGTVPGLLQPGTDTGWRTLAGPKPLDLAVDTMKYVVFNDPAWDISRFNPAKDYDQAMLADSDKVLSLALEFLHEHQTAEKKLVKA